MIEHVTAGLLGRHVIRRSENDSGLRQIGRVFLHDFRDAEVDELHEVRVPLIVHKHDVVGLHVAMDDVLVVRLLERLGDLNEDVFQLAAAEVQLAEDSRQAHPVEELHDDVEGAVGHLPEIHHLADVPALNRVGRLSLANEALEDLLAPFDAATKHLHREGLADDHLAARVDRAHASATHNALDAITAVDHLTDEILSGADSSGFELHERNGVGTADLLVVAVLPRARRADLHPAMMPESHLRCAVFSKWSRRVSRRRLGARSTLGRSTRWGPRWHRPLRCPRRRSRWRRCARLR